MISREREREKEKERKRKREIEREGESERLIDASTDSIVALFLTMLLLM